MVTATTKGVNVSVEVFYQPEYSKPFNAEFIFAYRITIKNCSEHTIKLIDRHWDIFDSNGKYREVSGEGVVGKQPVLEPDDTHQYISGCHLNTELGRMSGSYTMLRLSDGVKFKVDIPQFKMIADFKLC